MGIRLLGTLRLPLDPVDGIPLTGISGLTWDHDEQILYALSDRGSLFHLRPKIVENRLVDVERLAAFRLNAASGKPLQRRFNDAEGLAATNTGNNQHGDTELWISFEVEQRVARYTPTGQLIATLPLPAPLADKRRYQKANLGLEAITVHPQHGLLIAPEKPLKNEPDGIVGLYSLALAAREWRYPLHPSRGAALVAIEALADGSLLTLERAFVGLTKPLVIALRRVQLDDSGDQVQVRDIAIFDTSKGWLLDNFEGLASYDNNTFFLVSDDNESFLQSTLLVYFELLDEPAAQPSNPKSDEN